MALYKIPYATHNLPAALLEMGVLSKMIAGFFESERGYDRAAFRQLIKGNRDSSFTYLNRLGFYAKRAKSKWLFDYYKKCVVARLSAKIGEAAFPASARIGTDLFRINSHVELFDEATKLFVAKGNDPQVIFRNLPEIAATGVLTFYASSASTGNLFFSRTVEDKFSAADSMKFKVAAGVNVVRFDASQLSSEPLRTIRFDPMSRDGYFSVLALSYGAGEQVDQGALAVSAS
ncbi:hypothetical protein DID97_05565 [Burkholderia sp. Bp8977]|nr:hypothetical protein DIE09_06085 [Burkholderia sp. Bp9010]RQS80676.1 hypothetical protein DID97_05565 [Burkholderia sp. Bp8977]